MKRVLSFLCLTAFLCQTTLIQAAETATDAGLIEKEKEITKKRMLQINEAIQAYRKDHKDLPGYLSDLFPTYLTDTNVLLCPTAVREKTGLPFPECEDPKLSTHYGYEFSARPIQGMFGYSGPMTMATWKRMQMMVAGGGVPILRCFAYDKVINVSFDGNFYDSPLMWEELFQDKINPSDLQPNHLRLVMMKSLGAGMNPEELAFEELKDAVTRNDRGVMRSQGALSDKDKKWNQEVAQTSMNVATQAHKFLADFPQSTNSSRAAWIEQNMLLKAAAAGSTEADQQLQTILSDKLKAPGLSEDDRFEIRSMQERTSQTKLQGKPESEQMAAFQLSAQTLMKEFPKRSEPYSMLLSVAEDMEKAKALAIIDDISKSTNAPEKAKERANALLKRFNLVGHPLDIKFTALDGRNVDFAALKGKVVLVDFWATWCGPCVGELPHVKAAYDKFHTNGFEIVGISFDSDKAALEKFVKTKDTPWPQYFDGKGWQNAYGQQYGINSIPTMWLVDKKGNVVEMNAREDLAGKVERLIAEK